MLPYGNKINHLLFLSLKNKCQPMMENKEQIEEQIQSENQNYYSFHKKETL